jgi:hypothetical protein
MRKLVTLIMVALLALSLALVVSSCAKKAEDEAASTTTTTTTTTTTETMPDTTAMADTSMAH